MNLINIRSIQNILNLHSVLFLVIFCAFQVKTMIMGDIELTPILGITCHDDVEKKCAHVRKDEEGGIVNCLIQLQG